MAIAKPGYTSNSVSIDRFGFRLQYDNAGDLIDLGTIKEKYKNCSVLLGNSTSFGVAVTHDRRTLGHFLNEADSPCINLSVRGATMQQELAVFLTFKHLLPRPKRIVLLTGVCDVSLAVQPEDFSVPEAGGMHSMSTYAKQYIDWTEKSPDAPTQIKNLFLESAEDFYLKNQWFQKLIQPKLLNNKIIKKIAKISKAQALSNLKNILPLLGNVMETWSWIQKAQGIEINVALQPIAGWTKKKLTDAEQMCISADNERIHTTCLYANEQVYEIVKRFYQEATMSHGLNFIDTNSCFDASYKEDATLFSDFCHLTDSGMTVLGEYLRSQIKPVYTLI